MTHDCRGIIAIWLKITHFIALFAFYWGKVFLYDVQRFKICEVRLFSIFIKLDFFTFARLRLDDVIVYSTINMYTLLYFLLTYVTSKPYSKLKIHYLTKNIKMNWYFCFRLNKIRGKLFSTHPNARRLCSIVRISFKNHKNIIWSDLCDYFFSQK